MEHPKESLEDTTEEDDTEAVQFQQAVESPPVQKDIEGENEELDSPQDEPIDDLSSEGDVDFQDDIEDIEEVDKEVAEEEERKEADSQLGPKRTKTQEEKVESLRKS